MYEKKIQDKVSLPLDIDITVDQFLSFNILIRTVFIYLFYQNLTKSKASINASTSNKIRSALFN